MSTQPLRIRTRRRMVKAAGLLVLASLTACIFDRSDYQGGGRVDKGATANPAAKDAALPVPTDTTTPRDAATAPTDAASLGD